MNRLNLNWVSDTISDDYLLWQNGDIIRIEAQTGTGKTYFIKTKLLKYAISNNKKILYICNRVNLKRQMKIDVAQIQNIKINIKSKELDKLEDIGNITITSYQKIQYYLLNEKYGLNPKDDYLKYLQFDYIIMDECHYIVQDASFANETVFFYQDYLRQYSKDCITILISATMDYIKTPIEKIYNNMELNIHDYTTGIDYSYLDVYYFKKYEDIINTINNDTSGNKWLVFIGNIKMANAMLEKIEDSKFVCSQNGKYKNKNDDEELENIILNNKFNCKCLIATKSLDNGVNINDPLLTNIVIMALDKIDFIQMLGRKRIDIEDPQQVNLYIPAKSKKTFLALLNTKFKIINEEIYLYLNKPNEFNRKYDTKINQIGKLSNLFYRSENGWQLNKIGYLMFIKQMDFCEEMIKQFDISGEESFIHKQLEWINLEYNIMNWVINIMDNKEVKSLEEYLENIVGIQLFKEEKKELIDKINLRQDNKQLKSYNSLNACLQERKIPYMIIPKRNKNCRWWEVIKNLDV